MQTYVRKNVLFSLRCGGQTVSSILEVFYLLKLFYLPPVEPGVVLAKATKRKKLIAVSNELFGDPLEIRTPDTLLKRHLHGDRVNPTS